MLLLATPNSNHLSLFNQVLAENKVHQRAKFLQVESFSPALHDSQQVIDIALTHLKPIHAQRLKSGDWIFTIDTVIEKVGHTYNLQALVVAWDGQQSVIGYSGNLPIPSTVIKNGQNREELLSSLELYRKTAPEDELPRIDELINTQGLIRSAIYQIIEKLPTTLKSTSPLQVGGLLSPQLAQIYLRTSAILTAAVFIALSYYDLFIRTWGGDSMALRGASDLGYVLIMITLSLGLITLTHDQRYDIDSQVKRVGWTIAIAAPILSLTAIAAYTIGRADLISHLSQDIAIMATIISLQYTTLIAIASSLIQHWNTLPAPPKHPYTRPLTDSQSLNVLSLISLLALSLHATTTMFGSHLFFMTLLALLPALWSWTAWDFYNRYHGN